MRPWPSVSRPSSSTCSSSVEHVRVGLLDLVEQHHRVRAAAHRLGELPGLLVADVSGRRADQPADRVPLLELAHVQADHPVLVTEQRLGQRPGQLRLADTGRTEEQEAADRPVRVAQPGPDRRTASATTRTASSCPITRSCSRSSRLQQPLLLLLGQLR